MIEQGGTSAAGEEQAGPVAPVPPMTKGLMARLFVVPAIIVSVLLAVSMIVVLFGASSLTAPRPISELLDVLEKSDGRRQYAAILLPAEKEYWQAAQELSARLAQTDNRISPAEVEMAAARLIAILDKYPPGRANSNGGVNSQHFMMLALARLGSPFGVETLVGLLHDPDARTRQVAIQSLAEMGNVPAARQALGEVLPLLDDPQIEVRLVACVAVASLADRGDPVAIRALADHLESDREMQWNAAMTLALLGSSDGKLVLMNILDRQFWRGIDVTYDTDDGSVRRPLTEAEISSHLVAAVDAASHLDDADLTAQLEKLRNDESYLVRAAALSALERVAHDAEAADAGSLPHGVRFSGEA